MTVKQLPAGAGTVGVSRAALEGLGIATLTAGGFFVAAAIVSPQIGFWYLVWNLVLAYIPLALTFPLLDSVRKRGWSSWPTVAWVALWLVWLPNSFYVLSDMTHLLDNSYGLDPLLGVVLFGWFAALGMAAGLISLVAVHRAAVRQLGAGAAYAAVELVLLVSSVAVYVGRTLRWNSWDVLVHPVKLGQAVATGLLRPGYAELMTTLVFFGLLSGVYAALWRVFGEHK